MAVEEPTARTGQVGMTSALISQILTTVATNHNDFQWREEASSLHSNGGVSIRKRMDYEELCIQCVDRVVDKL